MASEDPDVYTAQLQGTGRLRWAMVSRLGRVGHNVVRYRDWVNRYPGRASHDPNAPKDGRRTVVAFAVMAALVATAVIAAGTRSWWALAAMPATFPVLLLAGFAAVKASGRLVTSRQRTITDPRDRRDWIRAVEARRSILVDWPALRRHVPVDDGEASVLAAAMWDLAGVLLERARVRAAHERVLRAYHDLPAGEPVAGELDARREQLAGLHDNLNSDVARRIALLTSLANTSRRFLRDQAAVEQARRVAREADAVLGATVGLPGGDHTAQELAERTTAVLTAYQDLQRETSGWL